MADTRLVLGGITFRDFEIPEKITLPGGEHTIHKHTLIGGQRVLDMMGPSPSDISWEGRFRGRDALSRFRSVDNLRLSGAEVALTYHGQFFIVVVSNFGGELQKFYEVPYGITCTISQVSGGLASLVPSLGALIDRDLSALSDLVEALP